MKKYVKVVCEKTKKCIVFEGTDIEYAISQGFTEQEVEEGFDGLWYLLGHAPVQPIEEQNEAIRQKREGEYTRLVDPLHSRKMRKQILNDWSDTDEAEYVAEVARLSTQIEAENPYIEEDNSDSVLSGEPENMA